MRATQKTENHIKKLVIIHFANGEGEGEGNCHSSNSIEREENQINYYTHT